jgi:DNA-binding CsgD family transcriptional regulator
MIIQYTLSIISLVLYLVIAVHVFIFNHRETLNKIFILACLCLAIWAFSESMLLLSNNQQDIDFWLKMGYFGILPFVCLLLHFGIELTKLFKPKLYFYIILYSTAVFIQCCNLFYKPLLYTTIINNNSEIVFVHVQDDLYTYLYTSFFFLYIISSFALIIYWGIKTKSRRLKKQAFIIGITMVVSITLGMFEEIYIPKLINNYSSHGTAVMLFLIWISGIWYTIIKYRFMAINPGNVSGEILQNIDEFVALIDNKMNIIYANEKIINSLYLDKNKGYLPENIFMNSERIMEESSKLIKNGSGSFSCRLNLNGPEESLVLADARFTAVKDRFGDVTGVLMIGREVKELKQFRTDYNLTDRETKILEQILNGRINREISDSLGIAERTVKLHITAIFEKLGVENRTQLFAYLKKFNLIPEHDAEKIIII